MNPLIGPFILFQNSKQKNNRSTIGYSKDHFLRYILKNRIKFVINICTYKLNVTLVAKRKATVLLFKYLLGH